MTPRVQVTGLEIAPERVLPPRDGVTFELGGFTRRSQPAHSTVVKWDAP